MTRVLSTASVEPGRRLAYWTEMVCETYVQLDCDPSAGEGSIDGEIAAIRGREKDKPTTIENSQYWIGPLIVVAESIRSRFRGFGRNWDFEGKSAEIVPIDWQGP